MRIDLDAGEGGGIYIFYPYVYLGSEVGWGLQFGSIPASPELEAYRDHCYARSARARANALDDAAMEEHAPQAGGV